MKRNTRRFNPKWMLSVKGLQSIEQFLFLLSVIILVLYEHLNLIN